ncbi:hypothetical protein ACHAQJ_004587 [Trichoderma viride]
MASNVTVLYNQPKDGEFFNMDYYVNTHMPIAVKNWTPHGLISWQVVKFGPDAPFYGGVLFTWEKEGDGEKALAAPATKNVLDDVPNFTNMQPTLIPGSITGSWTK